MLFRVPLQQLFLQFSGFSPRMMKGRYAHYGQFPYFSILFNGNSLWCGGSIIGDDRILTAAHCLDNISHENLKVAFGTVNLRYATASTPVAKVYKHPKYIGGYNDIALLKLMEPVSSFKTYAEPISLPRYKGDDRTRFEVISMGHGKTEFGSSSNSLLFTNLTISKCNRPETIICANGIDGKDTCEGDSGGPLVAYREETSPYLIGVVKGGDRFCRGTGYYTRVSYYLPWIRKITSMHV